MKILLYLKIVIHQKFITKTVGPKKGDEKKEKREENTQQDIFLKLNKNNYKMKKRGKWTVIIYNYIKEKCD